MLNLSQKNLAQIAGISVATLNNIERRAQTDPKLSTMKAIRQALEAQGIEFTQELSGDVGIRLKPKRAEKTTKTVLIIDDNQSDRTLYKNWLQRQNSKGYEILEANNARNGFELFEQRQPDCIILDFMMYGMDGFQLLAEMKRGHAKLPPIIFISGMYNAILEDSARAQGVYACLDKKNLTPDKLCSAVAEISR